MGPRLARTRFFNVTAGILLDMAASKAPRFVIAAVDAPNGRRRMPRRSALLDTSIIYCGDCLDQLRKLPSASVDLIYIDPPFNSNRDYEVFWGETKTKPQRPAAV